MRRIPLISCRKYHNLVEKILLVDDDKIFRSEFKNSLEEYDITEASTAEEALGFLRRPNDIDLVILDVMLPDSRGTDVLAEIKRLAPDTGIIILTGYSSEETAIDALRGHADEYLDKQCGIRKIKETIEKVLEAKGDQPDLECADTKGKIERVKRFIQKNLHKRITLKDAALAVCLSPKYLSRIFKEKTGTGLTRYRLRMRMEEAKRLLATTGYTVNQIADMSGYGHAEPFIRQFKKIAGFRPTEYRKKKRRRGVPR